MTILVCAAFSSRFRKLILAACGENLVSFALVFFRVEMYETDDDGLEDVVVEAAFILKAQLVFVSSTIVCEITLLGSEQ